MAEKGVTLNSLTSAYVRNVMMLTFVCVYVINNLLKLPDRKHYKYFWVARDTRLEHYHSEIFSEIFIFILVKIQYHCLVSCKLSMGI